MPTKRENPFSEDVKSEAWIRQGGRCAHCGDDLNRLRQDEGEDSRFHHIYKEQVAAKHGPDGFYRSSDNCAVLCERDHNIAHDGGRYRGDYITDPSFYPHSHDEKHAADRPRWEASLAGQERKLDEAYARDRATFRDEAVRERPPRRRV